MAKKQIKPKNVTALGWSGVWNEPKNTLGWYLTEFLHPKGGNGVNLSAKHTMQCPAKFYRVKISVELVTDYLGRPITKMVEGKPK